MANDTMLTIVGNLTDAPELRFTPSGVALARFTVASTPRMFDQASSQWKDGDAMFMTCTAWRALAENIAESLAKGTRIVVTGRLRLARWESKEGEKRQAHQLDVEEIGASLRYAQVTVKKLARGPALDGGASADAWASSGTSIAEDEPPF
jgi:single-strand DNA-binding protein